MLEAFRPHYEQPTIYPDLKSRIDRFSFRLRTFLWSFRGFNDTISSLNRELQEAVTKGKITQPLYLEDEKGGPGLYEIRMNRRAAIQLVDAAERFLTDPRKFDNFATAMSEDLEDLLTGNGPAEYYRRIDKR